MESSQSVPNQPARSAPSARCHRPLTRHVFGLPRRNPAAPSDDGKTTQIIIVQSAANAVLHCVKQCWDYGRVPAPLPAMDADAAAAAAPVRRSAVCPAPDEDGRMFG
ncbi:hypothetical protein ACFS07_12835 [Undibacterium arcticum]